MRNKVLVIVLFVVVCFRRENSKATSRRAHANSITDGGTDAVGNAGTMHEKAVNIGPAATWSGTQPKSIRDFFMLPPEKYFVLEGCERETDKD